MFRTEYLKAVWLCHILLQVPAAGLCPYKECSCSGYDIMCSNAGLTSVPPLIDEVSEYSSLILDGNHITEVPAGGIPAGLVYISLSNNPVTTIDDTAFNLSASSLHSLTFSNASFVRIPDAFMYLNTLKYLTIHDTKILDWNLDAMKHISQTVKILNLKNVGLTTWPTWIQYFANLITLSFDSSTMSFIPDEALDLLANSLSSLSISDAHLTAVPKTLSQLRALESLHLRSNRISDLTWLPNLSKLSSLSLSNNNISDANNLSNALLPYGDSLQSLEIHNNQLQAIPDLSFLKLVGSLDLSYNQISNSSSGLMPPGVYNLVLSHNTFPYIPSLWSQLYSVSSLYLSNNAVKEIRSTDFHPRTQAVIMDYNLITELTNTSFPADFGVLVLNLNNNPITTISENAFDGLHFLVSLKLQQTQLTRMPMVLASLVSLATLDMTGCPDLVCTCNEKNLGTWVLKISRVFGQCGRTNIYDFFRTLSPACSV